MLHFPQSYALSRFGSGITTEQDLLLFFCFYFFFKKKMQSQSFPRRSLDPILEEISPTDHEILRGGGTSSSLERLPSRLQQSKQAPTDLRQQLEDLVYEVSYLKAELQWQKESKQALLHFREEIFQTFHFLENAIIQVTIRLRESEQKYLGLWGLSPVGSKEGGMI